MMYKYYYIIFLLCAFFGCESRPYLNLPQNNALWTESIYFRGYRPSTNDTLTDSLIDSYCNKLTEQKIKYAYIFAGPFNEDGHLPSYAFSQIAKNSILKIKKRCPQISILPWIGGIQNKTVFLADPNWITNALYDTKRLYESLNCEGIHIDFEFVLKKYLYLDTLIHQESPGDYEYYGVNVNNFHKKLRELLPNAFISSVVTATSNDTKPWKRKTSLTELEELTKYINQISFLYYDTEINDQDIFEKNCAHLMTDIKFLKDRTPGVEYLIAIGTFINEPKYQHFRNLDIESIQNTLKTIKKVMLHPSNKKPAISGISIFGDWRTDEDEWNDIKKNWTGLN